jgi:hypothetical protein
MKYPRFFGSVCLLALILYPLGSAYAGGFRHARSSGSCGCSNGSCAAALPTRIELILEPPAKIVHAPSAACTPAACEPALKQGKRFIFKLLGGLGKTLKAAAKLPAAAVRHLRRH